MDNFIDENISILTNIKNISDSNVNDLLITLSKVSKYKYTSISISKKRLLIDHFYNTEEKIVSIFLFYLSVKHQIDILPFHRHRHRRYLYLIQKYSKQIHITTNPIINIKYQSTDVNTIIKIMDYKKKADIIEIIETVSISKMTNKNFEELSDKIIETMQKSEQSPKNYVVFGLTIRGGGNGYHCNLLLYDKKMNQWIRIAPEGAYDYDGSKESNSYIRLDTKIKETKQNYISHNEYYFLPSLHMINPGPYCGFYSIMILEEYVNGHTNLFELIEKITDYDYVKDKLNEYESILDYVK